MKTFKISLLSVLLVGVITIGSAFKANLVDTYYEFTSGTLFEIGDEISSPLTVDGNWSIAQQQSPNDCDELNYLCQIKVVVNSGSTPTKAQVLTQLKSYYDNNSQSFPPSSTAIEVDLTGFDYDIFVFQKEQ